MPVGAGFIPARIGENKKMTEHKKLQPEIRFAGFTDDWEQRKLGEVVERITRKNLNLESRLPLTISAQDGLISQTEFFDKQVASKNISGYYLIENGEFAYNKSYSNGYPWGAIKRLDKYKNGVLSTLYIVFNPIDVDSQFLVSYFDTTFWHSEIAEIAVEGARNHGLLNIPVMDFFRIKIKIPKSKEEQTQIGNFFKQLDDTIALHQRELEKFKILKTSYLEHIFLGKVSLFTAKNTITWEQRKAEDVFISISEKNHETFPVLSATQNKGMISRNDVGIDIKYDVNSLKTYKLVRKDQFVIHLRSFQGGFAHSAIDGITSPAYTILDFKDKRIHSPLFWREIFKSDFFIKRLESVIYGIRDGRSINYDEFLKLNFNYPSFEEQTQIGNFFKQLDDTIALHQKELAKYQQIKAACLEKMFVE